MKKLLIIVLLVCCVGSAFAQGSGAKAVVQVTRGAELTQQVSRQAVQARLASRLSFPLTFVNLPSWAVLG